MSVAADPCFSQLKAFMGGEDPKQNPNRGIESGCMAGRAFFAVRPDGSFTPCLEISETGNTADTVTIREYWEKPASTLCDGHAETCAGCDYIRRCRPCPAKKEWTESCPLRIIQ